MNVEFINPFINATTSVLETMCMMSSTPGKPYVKKDNKATGDVSGVLGLAGEQTGSFAVSFSESCIIKVVSNMLGEEITALNKDVEDAVGEITNMISGGARKDLGIMDSILRWHSLRLWWGKIILLRTWAVTTR